MPRVTANEFLSVIFHNVIRRSGGGVRSYSFSSPILASIIGKYNISSVVLRGSMDIFALWDPVIG